MSVTKKVLEYIKLTRTPQSELAKKIGYTQANLSRILSSDDIKISQLQKICTALDVPTYYFLEKAPITSEKEVVEYKEKILKLYEKLEAANEIIEGYEETFKSTVPKILNVLRKKEYSTREILEAIRELMALNKSIEINKMFHDMLSHLKKNEP